MASTGRSPAILALLCTLGHGCTTEVVDFPLKSSKATDAEAPDVLPWNCITKEIHLGKRCTYCTHPTSGATKTECEELWCKSKPFFDAGIAGCKYCTWKNHPKETCKMCWDSQNNMTFNDCHGKDAGP